MAGTRFVDVAGHTLAWNFGPQPKLTRIPGEGFRTQIPIKGSHGVHVPIRVVDVGREMQRVSTQRYWDVDVDGHEVVLRPSEKKSATANGFAVEADGAITLLLRTNTQGGGHQAIDRAIARAHAELHLPR